MERVQMLCDDVIRHRWSHDLFQFHSTHGVSCLRATHISKRFHMMLGEP